MKSKKSKKKQTKKSKKIETISDGLSKVSKILKKYEANKRYKPDWCEILGEMIEKNPNVIAQRR